MKFVARFVFHERKLMKMAERANRRILARCGAYVRKIARDFVRHRKNPNVHSAPGHSPYDHYGLRQSIIWASDENAAYIGPRLIRGGMNNVARLHEFGGTVARRVIDPQLWQSVKPGDIAPVTENHMAQSDVPARSEGKRDPRTGRKVFWIRIRTKSQAEHAHRLYRRFALKNAKTEMVDYPPRPYMFPALEKSLPHLPRFWKNAIK